MVVSLMAGWLFVGLGLAVVAVGWFVCVIGCDMEHTKAGEQRDAQQACRHD